MPEDVLEGGDRARVRGGFAQGGEGVGEGVRLELEADLDDVERRDDEPGRDRVSADGWTVRDGRGAYRDTRPAMAPAETTWSFVPCAHGIVSEQWPSHGWGLAGAPRP